MKFHTRLLMSCFIVNIALPPTWNASAQSPSPIPAPLAAAIDQARHGDFNEDVAGTIAIFHAVEARPILEEQFPLIKDDLQKALVASALVQLHDPYDTYWNFLAQQAQAALDDDAPFPVDFDAKGMQNQGYSRNFLQWSAVHHVKPYALYLTITQDIPARFLRLGYGGDIRGVPLLRSALKSRNYSIAVAAARALAMIQDNDSIPLLIDAINHTPHDCSVSIAMVLFQFRDPAAHEAAKPFLPAATYDQLVTLAIREQAH
jgi:hypothetical protein